MIFDWDRPAYATGAVLGIVALSFVSVGTLPSGPADETDYVLTVDHDVDYGSEWKPPSLRHVWIWTGSAIPQGEIVSATTSWADVPLAGAELIVRPGASRDWPATAVHHFDLMAIDSAGPGDVRVRLWDRATGLALCEITVPAGAGTTRLSTSTFSNLPIPDTNASVVTLQIKRDAGPTADAIIGSWTWFYEV